MGAWPWTAGMMLGLIAQTCSEMYEEAVTASNQACSDALLDGGLEAAADPALDDFQEAAVMWSPSMAVWPLRLLLFLSLTCTLLLPLLIYFLLHLFLHHLLRRAEIFHAKHSLYCTIRCYISNVLFLSMLCCPAVSILLLYCSALASYVRF